MQASTYDTPVMIESPTRTVDPVYGTELLTWASITGTRKLFAQVQDALPSRSESVTQGLTVARNQIRLRMPYRSGITSEMRVTIYRGETQVCQIVGGPARIGGREEALEMVLERTSS